MKQQINSYTRITLTQIYPIFVVSEKSEPEKITQKYSAISTEITRVTIMSVQYTFKYTYFQQRNKYSHEKMNQNLPSTLYGKFIFKSSNFPKNVKKWTKIQYQVCMESLLKYSQVQISPKNLPYQIYSQFRYIFCNKNPQRINIKTFEKMLQENSQRINIKTFEKMLQENLSYHSLKTVIQIIVIFPKYTCMCVIMQYI
eukprot:TRINITY_DN1234_c1_g1_i3.p1 TRINITY_DN1234_c1_g1~~TRINITY_DN1234_c1_g1_i3.p1  ORF type:complete len:219 (-),score=-13.04 TRINITY_DN1234_c1_g1_i3:125-721(-)